MLSAESPLSEAVLPESAAAVVEPEELPEQPVIAPSTRVAARRAVPILRFFFIIVSSSFLISGIMPGNAPPETAESAAVFMSLGWIFLRKST